MSRGGAPPANQSPAAAAPHPRKAPRPHTQPFASAQALEHRPPYKRGFPGSPLVEQGERPSSIHPHALLSGSRRGTLPLFVAAARPRAGYCPCLPPTAEAAGEAPLLRPLRCMFLPGTAAPDLYTFSERALKVYAQRPLQLNRSATPSRADWAFLRSANGASSVVPRRSGAEVHGHDADRQTRRSRPRPGRSPHTTS